MRKLLKSKIFHVLCCSIFVLAAFNYESLVNYNVSADTKVTQKSDILVDQSGGVDHVVYLSDIPYSKATLEYGTIGLDKTNTNTALTLLLNGSTTTFKKGIWAHATSTVEYDISEYSKDYAYFTTYYGLNTTAQNRGNGVKFYIYTSKDGTTWDLKTEENPTALKSANSVVYAKIDIRNAKYLRLYAHNNGSNASDHAVWADAKLVKEGYSENVTRTVEELDAEIKSKYTSGRVGDDIRLTLLQRDLINRVGQYGLRSFLEANPKNKETLEWFLNDEEALRLWTVGGTPNGSYLNSLQVLSNLYQAHKEDLAIEDVTPTTGIKYKDLYLKMMLSLSLTHSANVGLWIGGNQLSNAVTRYEIYKDMHKNGMLANTKMFEELTVEEMRWLMHVNIDDEEIKWLHDYSKKWPSEADRFNPYKYIKYTLNYGYYRPKYYDTANYSTWDKKYNLSKYNITYQAGKPKLWIVFEEGAVCGGLSKTAANLYGVWGYPASTIGQPGHCAFIYMYYVGGGKMAWQLSNNIMSTGWANTTPVGHMPNGWGGGGYYATNNGTIQSASYFFLAQEAQNEYEKYEQAELIMMLANVYKDDKAKLNQIYHDALDEEIINLDAWLGIINSAIASDSTMSEDDIMRMVEEVADIYTYHPLPMYDLTRRLGLKITSPEYKAKLLMIQNETLNKATKATGANTLQYKEVPVVAQAILGAVDSRIATFSFDGANAGKITLSKQLQSTQVTWSYSLDGGNVWKDCYDGSVQLSEEEISQIDVNHDIKVHIVGLPREPKNIYTIDITKGTFPSGVVTVNDEEDRMYGVNGAMEWTLDPSQGWNSFENTNPIFNGNKKVYLRVKASGTKIASDPVYFTFTENVVTETKAYIQSKYLTVSAVSGTKSGNRANIVDGNISSYWESARGSHNTAYIPAYAIIKLDRPRYITALDYYVAPALQNSSIPYGHAQNADILVSMDGTTWEKAASKTFSRNTTMETITFSEPKQALYVKFDCKSVYSSMYNSLGIGEIKLYEDMTVDETPYAEVNYNIVRTTNKDVTAELINPTRKIKVTNNGGKTTYTFTKNGEFTFEFEDEQGHKGSTTAKVTWIDKTAPEANVSYSTTEPTNEDVVASITFTKPVEILSKDIEIVEVTTDQGKMQTITFLENNSFDLKFKDTLGNVGSKKISVNWIDKEAPTSDFVYSTTDLTDKAVTATLDPDEDITVLNNGGKDSYTFEDNGSFTFEFEDAVGNRGEATANVYWIAKMPKIEVTYSNKKPTNKSVDVTLSLEEGYRLMNNGGKNVYTFEDSGEFAFEYLDKNGNMGRVPVKVDWIDKIDPTGTFKFTTTKPTNKTVVATLKPSEKIKIINNGGKDTYSFTKNGSFTFQFEDMVGNKGTATAKVDWIDRVLPTATFDYDIKTLTNKNVVVTLKPSKKVTVLNNGGKNTYTFNKNGEFTFEFIDEAGNKNKAVAKVNWIDKTPPKATIEYTGNGGINDPVTAILRPAEDVTIINNNGENSYTFTENGEFTFEFTDKVGNKGTAVAKVDWIGKEIVKPNPKPETKPESKPTTKPNTSTNKKPAQTTDKSYLDEANKPFYNTITADTSNSDKPFKEITSGGNSNIVAKIPQSIIEKFKGAVLAYETHTLTDSQKDRYGKESEIYELRLETSDKKAIDVKREEIEQTIKLNPNKQFVAIYQITEDGNIVRLNHELGDNNELVFKSNGLGKYIVSYQSDNEADAGDINKGNEIVQPSNTDSDENSFGDMMMDYLPYIVGGIVIIAGFSMFYVLKKKSDS